MFILETPPHILDESPEQGRLHSDLARSFDAGGEVLPQKHSYL